MGPVEYIIIGFPSREVISEIVPGLADLVQRDLIRIIDLVVIGKDDRGEVAVFEVDEDAELSAFTTLDGELGDYVGPEDIDHAAVAIEPGSAGLLLVWEDRWAAPLTDTMRRAGGVLIEGGRIPPELMDEAEAIVATAG